MAKKVFGNSPQEVIMDNGQTYYQILTTPPGSDVSSACGDEPVYVPKSDYDLIQIGPGCSDTDPILRYLLLEVETKGTPATYGRKKKPGAKKKSATRQKKTSANKPSAQKKSREKKKPTGKQSRKTT